jgi:predicted nucleic acid-binding protein
VKVWLLDTGPLVAYLDRRDSAHAAVAGCLDTFTGQLVTTSAVIIEAMHFVSESSEGPEALASFAHAVGLLVYECAHPLQLKEAVRLMRKYSDTPMDFADATLVLLADELATIEIVTLDRRGFSTYRSNRGRSFRLVLGC